MNMIRSFAFLLSISDLKLVVKFLIYFLLSIVCWCVDLDNFGVLTLRLEPIKDNPFGDLLPLLNNTLFVWHIIP